MTPTAKESAVVERTAKRWTYEEYYRLTPENHAERYEIDNGELVPMASPTVTHQRLTKKFAMLLEAVVQAHDLGEVFISPLDVVFGEHETSQPDVMFVAKARAEIVKDRGIFGAPDLVVEVISPSSTRRDRQEKSAKYLRFMVPEYWLVNPAERSIEVRVWREDHWAVHSLARDTGKAESLVLPDFSLDLAQLFAK